MDSIRVLHIVSEMQRGGVENMIMNFYRNIDRNKIQFDFIVHGSNKGHFEDEISELGGKIYHVTPKGESFIKNLKEINSVIKDNHYTIVHAHQDVMSMFALKEAKKAGAKNRIAHAHSTSMPPSFLGKFIYPYAIKNMNKVATHKFACSMASAKYLFNNDLSEVIYLYNGIDTEKFNFKQAMRDEVRGANGWKDELILGHIGNFLYPKNHDFVIKIFNELIQIHPNSKLILCGSGHMMSEIKEQVVKLGLEGNVDFKGNVSNISSLMQGMDCLILPSLYEGFPVVTVEAQAADLPIFVSDVITKETKITNAIDYLSLSDSPRVWAEHILKKSNNYQRENKISDIKNAGFDIKDVSSKLESLYLSM